MQNRFDATEMDEPDQSVARSIRGLMVVLGLPWVMACSGSPPEEGGPPPTVPDGHGYLMVEGVGLQAPQAVLYDSLADVYLVSNLGPISDTGEFQGFVSRIKPDGRVEALRWIDGVEERTPVHAPMGMAMRGDTLLIADGDCIRFFHRIQGNPLGSICTNGQVHLNDVTVDRHDVVYATAGALNDEGLATGRAGVYKIDTNLALREALGGEGLGDLKGISGSPRGVFFCGSDSGTVSQLTPDGRRRVLRGRGWRVSGIVFTRNGSFAFSNAQDSTVILVHARDGGSKGDVFTLVRNVPTPGDLGYDSQRERILIPQLRLNRLLFVDLQP